VSSDFRTRTLRRVLDGMLATVLGPHASNDTTDDTMGGLA
jgi:hypothetical protein